MMSKQLNRKFGKKKAYRIFKKKNYLKSWENIKKAQEFFRKYSLFGNDEFDKKNYSQNIKIDDYILPVVQKFKDRNEKSNLGRFT